jgi:hypothetical protein
MFQALIQVLACWLGKCQRPTSEASRLVPLALAQNETPSLPEAVIRIAEAEARRNVREQGGNNRGADVQRYQASTWLAGTGWAWCAAFICWCIFQALQVTGQTMRNRPRTAGAWDFEKWARGGYGPVPYRLMPAGTIPQRGDIVTFTWSHIGLVSEYIARSRIVRTVEGNTGPGTNLRDANTPGGDGVYIKEQPLRLIRRVIRYVG